MSLLANALHTYNPNYSRVEIKEVREWKNTSKTGVATTTVLVKVSGYGSRYCLNKGSDHTSQGIYFAITPLGGITQRCFSRKEVERRAGACSCFSSAPKPICGVLRDELFPDWKATNKQLKRGWSSLQEEAVASSIASTAPPRMVRARTTPPPGQVLAALEIPSLCS
jgi:hypothetical protein